jgi:hypothetical protein
MIEPETLVVAVGIIFTIVTSYIFGRAQTRRDARNAFLQDAYRTIEAAVNRPSEDQRFKALESALADVQLLGNEKEITVAHAMMETFNKGGDVGPLLFELRASLRKSLGLPPTRARILFFRTH